MSKPKEHPEAERQRLAHQLLEAKPSLPEAIAQLGGRAAHYLDVVLENLDAGALLIEGSERKLVLANQMLGELVGRTPEQVLALSRAQLVDRLAELSDEPSAVRETLERIPAAAPYAADGRFTLSRPRHRVISWRARPVRLPTGVGQLCLFRDITAEVETNRELVKLAGTDALTGLANRRAGLEFLEREVARCDAERVGLCVAVFDIDHFKRINDTKGHDAGDEVLKHVAHTLQRCVRRTDLAVRWGGEEFLAVFIDCELSGASSIAHRFRELLGDVPNVQPGQPVTVSGGIASHRPAESPGALLSRADALLYQAKQQGRDRLCVDEGAAPRGD